MLWTRVAREPSHSINRTRILPKCRWDSVSYQLDKPRFEHPVSTTRSAAKERVRLAAPSLSVAHQRRVQS